MALSSLHWETLYAVMDRIVPQDDYPAAHEAGVGHYLECQFRKDLASSVATYQVGLVALDSEADARHGTTFADLTEEQQDALLHDLEAGKVVTDWQTPPRQFLETLVNHVSEGYYADPGNGGNYHGISWQMIGFQVDNDAESEPRS